MGITFALTGKIPPCWNTLITQLYPFRKYWKLNLILCSAPAAKPDQVIYTLHHALHNISCVDCYCCSTDCWTFSCFFPLLEDPCGVLVTSLICQYSICTYSIYGLLICCISSLNDMTDFGLCRVQTRVCERACTLIKERYLISSPCARSLKIGWMYFIYCI